MTLTILATVLRAAHVGCQKPLLHAGLKNGVNSCV